MLALSFELPKQYVEKTGRGPIVFIVVLEKHNLERMNIADPADIQLIDYLKGPALNAPLKQLDLVIAYEEDVSDIHRLRDQGDTWGIVRWLERGRQIIAGDVTPPNKFNA